MSLKADESGLDSWKNCWPNIMDHLAAAELFPSGVGGGPKENLKSVNIEHKYMFGGNATLNVNRTKWSASWS